MNAFLHIADQQLANPVKAKHRAAEKRAAIAPIVLTPAEKKVRDQERLTRDWKKWRRDEQAEVREGEFAKELKGIETFLRTMAPSSAPALVALIRGSKWIDRADRATRHCLLTIIADGIRRLRERNGLPPFDDALPGEQPTAFDQIKEILR